MLLDTGGYPLMVAAVGYLIRNVGVSALANFWGAIGAGAIWQDAFIASFGETVDAFYKDFEAYRAVNLPAYPRLSGRITDSQNHNVLSQCMLVRQTHPEPAVTL